MGMTMSEQTTVNEPLVGWTGSRWLGGTSGPRLFNAILIVRWASLAIALLGYLLNLSVHQMEYGHFLPMLGAAVVYTAIISAFSGRVYEWQKRSDLFLAIDYAVTLVAFSTTGTVWNPFLIFGGCSCLFSGLRGNVRHGVVGGLIAGALLLVSLPVKAVSLTELVVTDSLVLASVYIVEFVGFSAAWAYAVHLLGRLDAAYLEVDANREGLARANAALDERRRQFLALHGIRHAILLNVEAEEIVRIVMQALEESGFSRPRTWLLTDGRLVAFPEEPGSPEIDVFGTHPLAVAAHDRETVVTECGSEHGSDDGLPPACVAVPILTGTDVLGVVAVENDPSAPLSDHGREVLEHFADQIALALSHLRAYERARELAVSEERDRVTTEIHRSVVQRLYDASVLAETLSGEGDVSVEAAGRLRALRDAILDSLQDLRFAVLDWRSLERDSGPLEIARRYAREFASLSGIEVTLDAEGEEPPCSPERLRELLGTMQDVMSSAWRHANAKTVRVRIEFAPHGVSVFVIADGMAFDADAAAEGTGFDLRSIEDRAAKNGGSVEVTGDPGGGACVRVWIPCD